MDYVLIGRFQDRLIEVLEHGTDSQKRDVLHRVPLSLANSIPVLPEVHLVDIKAISKN